MSSRSALAALGLAVAALSATPLHAQTLAKPSALVAKRQGRPLQVEAPDPAPFLNQLPDRASFDRMARVYDPGTPEAQPHLLFVIDRQAPQGQVLFVNTRRFALHEEFLKARHLVTSWEPGVRTRLYQQPQRRFILGMVSWQPQLKGFVYEFWEGDRQTPELLRTAQAVLAREMSFAPLRFKANAAQHEQVAKEAGIEAVTQAQLIAGRSALAYNPGRAFGRLRLVEDIEQVDDLAPEDIVVLREAPLALPPVAGVILASPSTALSHVNLLAKGWGIPNLYLRDAWQQLQGLDGQTVWLDVRRDSQRIEPRAEAPAGWRPVARQAKARLLSAPDLRRQHALPLAQMRLRDMSACGGKAARLGELRWLQAQGRLPATAPVPDGFCIPYGAFAAFMAQPVVKARVAEALSEGGFEGSPGQRRAVLARLREDLLAMPLPAGLEAQWTQQWERQLDRAGVFVRSSSNSEDLANFSGAGLYTTVPNVRAELARAVKQVWASVWNAEAFEARRQAGLRHEQVQMAVLVQKAVDARMSGVMITRDPFDATRSGVVYVSAKRGIGIKVVEGKRIAEQALFDERSGAIERLSSSAESTELRLDESGGLKEVAVASAAVLQDAQVLALARLALAIRRELGGVEQDIEWAIDGEGRLVMLQARPFVQRSVY